MHIGIGLPTTAKGATSATILDWARRADAGPFASVGVFDRLVYDSFEPLATLAAVAAVTERVRRATTVVIGPLRNTALLAKEAATIDQLSGGRLTLGLALGARRDDYEAAGIDYAGRGQRLDEQLADLRDIWEDEASGPRPVQPGGPELIVGGLDDAAYARAARYADRFMHNGGPPRSFAAAADRARSAWVAAGRPGQHRARLDGRCEHRGRIEIARDRRRLIHRVALRVVHAEHDQAALALRCEPASSEEQRYQGVVASAVVRAMFPSDATRRAFLKSVGASTAIFGLIGAEAVFLIQNRKLFAHQFRSAIGNVLFIIFVNLFLGLAPSIDNWGHIGGLVGGLMFTSFAGPLWDVEGSPPVLQLVDRREARDEFNGAIVTAVIFGALAMWGFIR